MRYPSEDMELKTVVSIGSRLPVGSILVILQLDEEYTTLSFRKSMKSYRGGQYAWS